jgi:GT2 family glycosyltransferase
VDSSGKIGVVTVTYNSGAVIRDFVESLVKQTHRDFLLYVIDNASTDDTVALLADYPAPRIVVVRNPTNVGVAEGNNIGIRAALRDGCTSVLLINNDTVFGPDMISRLHEGLGKYQCDMIVPKIVYFDPADKIWSAGGTFSILRGRSKHLGMGQKDDGRFDEQREVKYSPTCCMLITRKVFERIGIMDPNYFLYFDDADFCLRAQRAGIRLVYSSDSKLSHKVSSIIGHRSDISVRYVTRNHVYFVLKNFRPLQVLYYLPICQAHIFVRCLLAKDKAKAFWIAQRAFWEGISVFRSTPRSTDLLASPYAHFEATPQSVPGSSDDL